ncbi:MAG: hypothetical protein H7Y30_03590 [Pyrinomonadaceae bacterium]|nr:hypothetical protein [Pyrinomonadaceae bacterium]
MSDNKAWCPQCNQPLEVEETRRERRELDSLAGTLNESLPPVEPDKSTPDAKVADASPAQPANIKHPTQTSIEETQFSQNSTAKPSRLLLYVVVGTIAGLIVLIVLAAVLFAFYFLR